MIGRIVKVWVDDEDPERIQFLVVRRNGQARKAYADRGSRMYDLLARRLS